MSTLPAMRPSFPLGLVAVTAACAPQPPLPAPPDATVRAMPGEVQDPATAAPGPDYEAHLRTLRARLPHDGFHVVVEKPFVVLGDGGAAAVERCAERTVRWAVRLLQQDFFDEQPGRILDVWLFDGADSYRKHTRQVFGDTPHTPFGYYSARHGALIMNIATGGGTLVHELVHPFVEADFPACPAWLNEGLGSLFEQCHEKDGHIAGLTNWRLDGLQEAIRDGRTVRLSALVATTSDRFYGPGSGLHYAMARYLCYWLQERGRLRAFYRAFRQGAAEDGSGARFLRAAIGCEDLDAWQAGWERWLLTLSR
jgi:hypothetical protein